jgi:hypothetical protein
MRVRTGDSLSGKREYEITITYTALLGSGSFWFNHSTNTNTT